MAVNSVQHSFLCINGVANVDPDQTAPETLQVLSLCMLGNFFMILLSSADLFTKFTF